MSGGLWSFCESVSSWEQPAHTTRRTCWRSGLKYPVKPQAEGSCTLWKPDSVNVSWEGKWEEQKSERRPLFILQPPRLRGLAQVGKSGWCGGVEGGTVQLELPHRQSDKLLSHLSCGFQWLYSPGPPPQVMISMRSCLWSMCGCVSILAILCFAHAVSFWHLLTTHSSTISLWD